MTHNAENDALVMTAEGGGFVLKCTCQWERFCASRGDAESARVDHRKKCKGPKVKTEAAPQRARSIGWDDREGATWIDSL